MIAFKNALYLKLAQNYLRYRWVITYLFGAAPVAEQGFFDQEVPEPVRSFRNSDHGYVNKEEIQVSFASLEDYVSAIENYIEQGDLIAEKEFYSAVRFRGQKVNSDYPIFKRMWSGMGWSDGGHGRNHSTTFPGQYLQGILHRGPTV